MKDLLRTQHCWLLVVWHKLLILALVSRGREIGVSLVCISKIQAEAVGSLEHRACSHGFGAEL